MGYLNGRRRVLYRPLFNTASARTHHAEPNSQLAWCTRAERDTCSLACGALLSFQDGCSHAPSLSTCLSKVLPSSVRTLTDDRGQGSRLH